MEIEKWAIYARASTDREEQKTSVPNQVGYCTEWVQRRGAVVYDIYVDDGISGKSLLIRPDVQRLLKDAEAKKFVGVVFNNISRFGRDNLDLLWMKRKLCEEWGLTIIGLEEGYDSTKDDDEMLFMIHAGMSQVMRKKLSRQIKNNCMKKAERGEFPLATPPIGYIRPRKIVKEDGTVIRPENYKLQIDTRLAPVVQAMFELARQGYGPTKIIQAMLDGETPFPFPVPPQNGARMWWRKSILEILRNPVYKGSIVYNTGTGSGGRKKNPESKWVVTENAHPPIVSKEVFDKVQTILNKRRTERGLTPNNALLIGIVKCGICGFSMRYEKKRSISSRKKKTYNTYEYYECAHGYRDPSLPKEKTLLARVEDINDYVLGFVKEAHFNPSIIDEIVKNRRSNLIKESTQNELELKSILKELSKVERNFRKDLEAFRAGAFVLETYKQLQAENELAKENLLRRRAVFERANTLQESLNSRVQFVKDKLAKFAEIDISNHAQLKMFLADILEKVVIHSPNDVEIKIEHLDQDVPKIPLFLVQ